MTDVDPHATRRDLVPNIPAELLEAGFDNVEEIGRGGFGVVYRCVQPSLDRAVAVKVLSTDLDRDNLERFLREQRAMGRLSGHPHIVTVLQVGVLAGGRPFIVMPYHAKNSLETLIRRHGPLDWRETLSIGVKLAGALEAAHRVGTLHRDVKPGNILLTDYGEPQLTDFGIARIAGGFETATGVIAGSPAFTAPEVLEGASPTPASDVYSLGATLFCALTGHAAYERRSGERVIAQFLRITSQPIPDLRKQGLRPTYATGYDKNNNCHTGFSGHGCITLAEHMHAAIPTPVRSRAGRLSLRPLLRCDRLRSQRRNGQNRRATALEARRISTHKNFAAS